MFVLMCGIFVCVKCATGNSTDTPLIFLFFLLLLEKVYLYSKISGIGESGWSVVSNNLGNYSVDEVINFCTLVIKISGFIYLY